MIKTTGITAEYNPLHNGHVWQLEQAKTLSGCDAIAVAMSGDFVQRGEPAIVDKWTRCAMALEAGADLVVEIPVQFCLGNAAQYASASVKILEALGCGHIAFGSECGDAGVIRRTADMLASEKEAISRHTAELTKKGLSYPAARSEAYKEVRSGADPEQTESELAVLSNPNDILGLEYVMHMNSSTPLCIKRTGTAHDGRLTENSSIQSAGTIRDLLKGDGNTDSISGFVPEHTLEMLRRERLVFPEDCTSMLRYAAEIMDADRIEECPSTGEGLGGLIKRSAHSNTTLDEIIMGAKSKRYTYTRISRLCMQMILGIDRRELASDIPLYIRVLGFSEKGRELLAGLRDSDSAIPVITNINKETAGLSAEAKAMLELDIRAADIYNLIAGTGTERSDRVMRPVMN